MKDQCVDLLDKDFKMTVLKMFEELKKRHRESQENNVLTKTYYSREINKGRNSSAEKKNNKVEVSLREKEYSRWTEDNQETVPAQQNKEFRNAARAQKWCGTPLRSL